MKGRLDKTLELLATTNNEAATDILLHALEDPDRDIQTVALRALVRRRGGHGHRELLLRWHTFSERFKSTIAEQSSRMSGAVRDAILSAEETLAENGLDAVLRLQEYDLIPALLTAAEDKSHALANKAATAVLALSEMLHDELAGPREKHSRRDPQRTRQFLIASLEKSAARFDQHKNLEILEACMLLATTGNATLRRFLQNPHSKAYLPAINLLSHSTRPGVQRLLLGFLDDPNPPHSIHSTLSKRQDVPFLKRFFRRMGQPLKKTVQLNLRRIESFQWLNENLSICKTLSPEEQCGAIHLVVAAGVNQLQAFEAIKFMLQHGAVEARRVASASLDKYHGSEANQLVLRCLEDSDSDVRANVVGQLRDRGIPNAMQLLLELVTASDQKVSGAARESLSEFSFDRFLASFDMLDEDVAQNTAFLVMRIDPDATSKLAAEFEGPSRTRRKRAINIAVVMNAVRDVEPHLVDLLSDPDHLLRAEAAQALKYCDTPATRQALRELLLDRSPSVQEAAEQTLQSFAEAASPPTTPLSSIDLAANSIPFGGETPQ